MALIRAFFGVEREFDRYYLRLKEILKGNFPLNFKYQVMKKVGSRYYVNDQQSEEEEDKQLQSFWAE